MIWAGSSWVNSVVMTWTLLWNFEQRPACFTPFTPVSLFIENQTGFADETINFDRNREFFDRNNILNRT